MEQALEEKRRAVESLVVRRVDRSILSSSMFVRLLSVRSFVRSRCSSIDICVAHRCQAAAVAIGVATNAATATSSGACS